MIIVKIMGGLGNQLFQYAAARALAYRWAVPLKLDTSFFSNTFQGEHITQRSYQLDFFNINTSIATQTEIAQARGKLPVEFSLVQKIHRKVYKLLGYTSYNYFEQSEGYDIKFKKKIYPLYLHGYWQSFCYFKDIFGLLTQEFSLKALDLDTKVTQLLSSMAHTESIAVHIRRGDYLNAQNACLFYDLSQTSYYNDALAVFYGNKKLQNVCCFVFSDDIHWAKMNFKPPFLTVYLETNDLPAYQNLYLMSLCKHQITANSTFSWWGALLNKNEGKIVVAPQHWFKNYAINPLNKFPDRWIIL